MGYPYYTIRRKDARCWAVVRVSAGDQEQTIIAYYEAHDASRVADFLNSHAEDEI